ncbi:MAG: suppressor of fused domain protein [Chthoniobacter sp.]|nr:suppressor of fused domain protein [Chthoniobacter sp.]
MPTETTPENDDWKRIWDARLAALESILGKSADTVGHAVVPFYLGGTADVLSFPHYVPGFTFVTADLTGEDVGQKPNSLGNYELMICTRSDFPRASDLISKLARYTCDAVLEPGQSMDLATFFGDSTLQALLFTHPTESPAQFTLEGQPCGLLLCIGITKDELEFKKANGSAALLEKLHAAGVFPYTVPDRTSVLAPPPEGFLGRLFGR